MINKRVLFIMIGITLISMVGGALAQDRSEIALDRENALSKEMQENQIEDVDDVETTNKVKKIGEKIAEVPETTGNMFLGGFNRVGDWVEEKSGNKFEVKWNTMREEDKRFSPQNYGLEKDPANGI